MNDDELDILLAERGARWREEQAPPPAVDVGRLPGSSQRRWVAPLAAAAAVAAVIGGVVWATDEDGGRRGDDPAPIDVSEVPDDFVVPWDLIRARNPEWPDARAMAPLELRQVSHSPGPGWLANDSFVIELRATERHLSLAVCPDVEITSRHVPGEFQGGRYGLNCDDVPYRDGDGVPYLPEGVPVRFALEVPLAERAEQVVWTLQGPEPQELPLEVTAPPSD